MVFNRTALSLHTHSCCVEGAVDLRDHQAGHLSLPCLISLSAWRRHLQAREAPESGTSGNVIITAMQQGWITRRVQVFPSLVLNQHFKRDSEITPLLRAEFLLQKEGWAVAHSEMLTYTSSSSSDYWGKMDCAGQRCHWEKNHNALQKL